MSSSDDDDGDKSLCLYFPQRPANISPRSEIKMFSFTIDQIEKYPALRGILTPLTIPKHSLFIIAEESFGAEIPVYSVFGDNILRKFVQRENARLVFENYLSEITATIPFSGEIDINMFSNTINGLSPERFLEVIRIKFFEEE